MNPIPTTTKLSETDALDDLKGMKEAAQEMARELIYEDLTLGDPKKKGFQYYRNHGFLIAYWQTTATILQTLMISSAIRSIGDQMAQIQNVAKDMEVNNVD